MAARYVDSSARVRDEISSLFLRFPENEEFQHRKKANERSTLAWLDDELM